MLLSSATVVFSLPIDPFLPGVPSLTLCSIDESTLGPHRSACSRSSIATLPHPPPLSSSKDQQQATFQRSVGWHPSIEAVQVSMELRSGNTVQSLQRINPIELGTRKRSLGEEERNRTQRQQQQPRWPRSVPRHHSNHLQMTKTR